MPDHKSNKVLLIDECSNSSLKLMESLPTPTGNYTNGIIATLYGTLSDYGNETRNQRWYTGSLWRKVLSDKLFKEALDTKTLFGEPDHPLDIENRLETHIPYVSHIIRDPKINEAKQVVEGYIDVLDTPNGRIIKTLLDYGCILGVSSRGCGDLTYEDGKTVVDESTYTFITWDIVARPSNQKARVNEIDTVDANGKTAFESLKEQVTSMINNHDIQSLKLTESLIKTTNIPEKDQLITRIHESINNSDSDQVMVPKSDLDDAYDRIMKLKSENSELDHKNKQLTKSLEESDHTMSDLKDLNKNLNSIVASYMDTPKKIDPDLSTTKTDENGESSELRSTITNSQSEILDKLECVCNILKTDVSSIKDEIRNSNDNHDQYAEYEELRNKYNRLITELKSVNAELSSAKKALENSQNENISYIRKISSVTNEYFKLRCSQLGLNESVALKEFNNRLYEYDLSDLNEILIEMYSKNNSKKSISESMTISGPIGSIQLQGSIKSKSSSIDPDSDIDSALVESIRQMRTK